MDKLVKTQENVNLTKNRGLTVLILVFLFSFIAIEDLEARNYSTKDIRYQIFINLFRGNLAEEIYPEVKQTWDTIEAELEWYPLKVVQGRLPGYAIDWYTNNYGLANKAVAPKAWPIHFYQNQKALHILRAFGAPNGFRLHFDGSVTIHYRLIKCIDIRTKKWGNSVSFQIAANGYCSMVSTN